MNKSLAAGGAVALVVLCSVLHAARADIVFYRVPNSGLRMALQGRTAVNPGGTVTFVHPRFGTLYFDLKDVEIHKLDSLTDIYRRKINRAKRDKDVAALMETAEWSLRNGMLTGVYEAVAAVLEIDPQHEAALRIKNLKGRMDQPLPEKQELEDKLRQTIPLKDMRIARSKHFILLHDTPDKPAEGRKVSRAEERLDLLERVYESFLLKFYSRGVELEIPDERLMVVLFNDIEMFKDYAVSLSPSLASAAGFWSPTTNISIFFDHGTDEDFKALRDVAKQMHEGADQLRRQGAIVGNVVRFARTLDLLVQVSQEASDIEVVSHEATHQMAGNTGLLPRGVRVPAWAHEGLATYFEAPNDAAWAGIGAVNEQRLEWYRALASDREHSNIDFIIGDEIFDYAGNHGATLHAYGQAWALTHFLMEHHLDKFMEYYRRLGEFPPDTPLSSEVLTKIFNEVFGEKHDILELQWRDYMRSLKTDIEIVLEGE
jgi:hypothetical protein